MAPQKANKILLSFKWKIDTKGATNAKAYGRCTNKAESPVDTHDNLERIHVVRLFYQMIEPDIVRDPGNLSTDTISYAHEILDIQFKAVGANKGPSRMITIPSDRGYQMGTRRPIQ